MSKPTPNIPERYTPVTAVEIKDALAAAICSKIDRDRIATSDIAKRYSTIRAADVASIRRGEHQVFGINRLTAIAEAIGLRARVVVSG